MAKETYIYFTKKWTKIAIPLIINTLKNYYAKY